MAVTARFKVSRVTEGVGGDGQSEVEMTPDYAQGRNAEWAKYTPSGVIRLVIGNPAALEQLPLHQAVSITFEPTEE